MSTAIDPELQRDFRSWQGRQFFGARIETLRNNLNEVNRTKFEALDYDHQCLIVAGLIEKGSMI